MNLKQTHKNIIISITLFMILISYFLFKEIGFNSLIISLLILIGFYTVERHLSINFKIHHYSYTIIIIFSILFFYYIQSLFIYIDKFLHLIGGFMLASVTYHTFKKISITKNYALATAFLFSLIIIISYEGYEYGMDQIFGENMRGVYQMINNQLIMVVDPLKDTIQDVALGIVGFFLFFITTIKNKN